MRRKTSPDTSGSKKQSSNRRGTQQLFYTEAFKQKIVNEVLSGKLNNFTWPTHISIKWRHGKESDESGKGIAKKLWVFLYGKLKPNDAAKLTLCL
ncbi:MAG: hypothetical protein V9F46_10005 [Chitinophagaceae bacterium]